MVIAFVVVLIAPATVFTVFAVVFAVGVVSVTFREAGIITEVRSPVVGRAGLGAVLTVLNSVKIIQRIIISGLQAAALSAQNSFPVKGHSSHLLSGMRRYL